MCRGDSKYGSGRHVQELLAAAVFDAAAARQTARWAAATVEIATLRNTLEWMVLVPIDAPRPAAPPGTLVSEGLPVLTWAYGVWRRHWLHRKMAALRYAIAAALGQRAEASLRSRVWGQWVLRVHMRRAATPPQAYAPPAPPRTVPKPVSLIDRTFLLLFAAATILLTILGSTRVHVELGPVSLTLAFDPYGP